VNALNSQVISETFVLVFWHLQLQFLTVCEIEKWQRVSDVRSHFDKLSFLSLEYNIIWYIKNTVLVWPFVKEAALQIAFRK